MEATAGSFGDALTSVQVTYVDPKSGNICRRDVFLDLEDWNSSVDAPRFIITSELVNLLSEAVAQRHIRWQTRYDQLANYRFAYECVLWTLRNDVNRLATLAGLGDSQIIKTATGEKEEEPSICPIHFFRPDWYLDKWTCERVDKAIKSYSEILEQELEELSDRIKSYGGFGWYDLLKKVAGREEGEEGEEDDNRPKAKTIDKAKASKKHHLEPKKQAAVSDPLKVSDQLLEAATDEERHTLENRLTGGCRDLLERLKPTVEAMEPEFQDFGQRSGPVSSDLANQKVRIADAEEKLKALRARLARPTEALGPESDSEISEDEPIDNSQFLARVASLVQQLFDEWRLKNSQAADELAAARKAADEAEARWRALDKGGKLQALDEEVKTLEKNVEVQSHSLEQLEEKSEKVRARRVTICEILVGLQDEVSELEQKIEELPPPSPRTNIFQQYREQLKKLELQAERLMEKMKSPADKVRAIRYQLKQVYAKYGWDWDYSDSEDEEEEQPYWMRRKLASEGLAKFNPNDFIYSERTFRSKRSRARERKIQEDREKVIFSSMAASRRLHDAAFLNPEELARTRDLSPFSPSEAKRERSGTSVSFFRRTAASSWSGRTHSARTTRSVVEADVSNGFSDEPTEVRETGDSWCDPSLECDLESTMLPPGGSLMESSRSGRPLPPLAGARPVPLPLGSATGPQVAAPPRSRCLVPNQSPTSQSCPNLALALSSGAEGQAGVLPLVGPSQSRPRRASKQGSRETLDFGFRPDGAGESRLETWRLFKVSKDGGGFGGRLDPSPALMPAATLSEEKAYSESRFAKLQRRLQAEQRELADWNASAPDLRKVGGDGSVKLPSFKNRSAPEAKIDPGGSLARSGKLQKKSFASLLGR